MNCPSCQHKLIHSGNVSIPYETLDEHVSGFNPSKKSFYYCDNYKCDTSQEDVGKKRIVLCEKTKQCNPIKKSIFWSRDGERYGHISGLKFVDNNDGPFGSISRRLNVEIYKKDENFQLINIWFYIFKVVYKYTADEYGEILKRKITIQISKKDDIWKCIKTFNFTDKSYIGFVSTFSMFKFQLRQFRGEKKEFHKLFLVERTSRRQARQSYCEKIYSFYNIKKHMALYDFLLALYLNVFQRRFYTLVKSKQRNK